MMPPTELNYNIYSAESRHVSGFQKVTRSPHLITLVSSDVCQYSKCEVLRFGGIRLKTHDKQIPVDSQSILV